MWAGLELDKLILLGRPMSFWSEKAEAVGRVMNFELNLKQIRGQSTIEPDVCDIDDLQIPEILQARVLFETFFKPFFLTLS